MAQSLNLLLCCREAFHLRPLPTIEVAEIPVALRGRRRRRLASREPFRGGWAGGKALAHRP